ncbi:hypothetical protein BH09MYX1_BH09MYX1_48660 [soil metagenome]
MRLRTALPIVLFAPILVLACGSDDGANAPDGSSTSKDAGTTEDVAIPPQPGIDGGGTTLYGKPFSGGEFHLGPVDYEETQWHNACAPGTKYAAGIRSSEGVLLAGLWSGIPNVAQYCDACIFVKTAKGKTALLRVVTYGDTTANSIDVSPQAYSILNSGESPRSMEWWFAKCPASGNVMFEFQTGSSEWWTSLWVRNARLPITKVEVKSANHAQFVTMDRGGDGTLTDAAGFGKGTFTIRLTARDATTYEETIEWPGSGIAGQMITGKGNFQ